MVLTGDLIAVAQLKRGKAKELSEFVDNFFDNRKRILPPTREYYSTTGYGIPKALWVWRNRVAELNDYV